MSDRRAVFVVNPASDGGRTGKKWPEIADSARRHGLQVVERLTESAGHATELTRQAVAAGEELIVAVGGDGTVNEVVNGFFDTAGEPLGAAAALGVIERGTGCDFVRTFDIPKKTDRAVATIAAGRRRRIDIGRATCATPAGPQVRMFANIASCGTMQWSNVSKASGCGDMTVIRSAMRSPGVSARTKNALIPLLPTDPVSVRANTQ